MAVAIGANTAIFSVYDRLVLNPVTIPDPSSLVAIWFNNPHPQHADAVHVGAALRASLRATARSFPSMGMSAFDSFTLTGAGDAAQLTGLRVSASFLPTLGIGPARGRNFTDDGGRAEWSRRLHPQPRALAAAVRRARVDWSARRSS